MLKHELLKSGAIINTKESNFDRYRREVEIWFRSDSESLHQCVGQLIDTFPDLQMRKSGPIGRTNGVSPCWFIWTCHEPKVKVTLDVEDCLHLAKAGWVSLRDLLSRIADNGCEDAMAFRIAMDVEVWNRVNEYGQFAA